jgi:hypothetical protein
MKRFLRIFELSKNEQRVVLLVMLVLITIAFIGYERRRHRFRVQDLSRTEGKPSAMPARLEHDH